MLLMLSGFTQAQFRCIFCDSRSARPIEQCRKNGSALQDTFLEIGAICQKCQPTKEVAALEHSKECTTQAAIEFFLFPFHAY